MTDKNVQVKITATDSTRPAFDSATKNAQAFSKNVKELVMGGVAVLAGGVLGEFFKASIEQSMEVQKNFVDLSVALRNVGADANSVAPQVEALVNTLAGKTGLDPDKMLAATNRLIVQIGSYKGAMSTLPTVLDVSVARHIDMEKAVTLVAKAYQGNEGALKKLGVAVKEGETPFDALRRTYKGFAEEEGKTFEGSLGRIHAKWKEVLEQTGDIITGNKDVGDVMGWVSTTLANMAVWIDHNRNAIGDFVSVVAKLGQGLMWLGGVAIQAVVDDWKLLEATVIEASGGFYMIPQAAKLAFGEVLDVFADFATKANTFLNKLGIHIGDGVASKLKESAKAMIGDARQQIEQIDDDTQNAITRLNYGKHDPEKNRKLPPNVKDNSEGDESKRQKDELEKSTLAAWKVEIERQATRKKAVDEINAALKEQQRIIDTTAEKSLAHKQAIVKQGEMQKLLQEADNKSFQEGLADIEHALTLDKGRLDTAEKLVAEQIKYAQLVKDAQSDEARKIAEDRLKALKAAGKPFGIDATVDLDKVNADQREKDEKAEKARRDKIEREGGYLKGVDKGVFDTAGAFIMANQAAADFDETLGRLGGETVVNLAGAFATAFQAIGQGQNVFASLGKAARQAVGQAASAEGAHEFALAIAALARSFNPNPLVSANALAEAAFHAKAGAALSILGGALSAGGGGSSGGAGGASVSPQGYSNAQSNLGTDKGAAQIIITGGFLDMSDPRQSAKLQQALQDLSGRRVTITT